MSAPTRREPFIADPPPVSGTGFIQLLYTEMTMMVLG
jgi:hypothetical protein